MILIAESGSTKTTWVLIEKDKIVRQFESAGFNPYTQTEELICKTIKDEVSPEVAGFLINSIHFYGAGCSTDQNKELMRKCFQQFFPKAKIEIEHDLIAAARALWFDKPGIVAILGTGSNSGYYNGKKIMRNSPGLGYVLGDEGSGAYMGKKVLQYYLYRTFDAELHQKFQKKYQLEAADILDAVYKKPLPNRYIASFTLFLAENRGHYMIENIIEDSVWDFFSVHLARYPESGKIPVFFTGSVAFGFQDILKELCKTFGWKPGRILAKPMEGLITYHKTK